MFSFKGITDTSMGIYSLPYTRTLKPAQRVVQTYIQGRSGTYDWSDGSYENGTITIPCIYFGANNSAALREIAAWLTGSGQLIFDDEPGKYYLAHLYAPTDLSRLLYEESFSLTFTVYPFALSPDRNASAIIQSSADSLSIISEGTAETPCIISFTNNGSQTINTLTITHSGNI